MLKKGKIGQSAAKPRIEERSTTSPKGRRNFNSEVEQPKSQSDMVKIWSIPLKI